MTGNETVERSREIDSQCEALAKCYIAGQIGRHDYFARVYELHSELSRLYRTSGKCKCLACTELRKETGQ